VKRIEEIVQFLLRHDGLTEADLTAIWNSQNGQQDAVVRNIFGLVSKLASDFNGDQQQLLTCFKNSWYEATSANTRSKLLDFIKQLAKDGREATLANEVLATLWCLSDAVTVAVETTQLALDAHIEITSAYYYSNRPDKEYWIERFMTDLGNPAFVVPALVQIEKIVKIYPEYKPPSYGSYGDASRGTVLARLNEGSNLISKLCHSRVTCCLGSTPPARTPSATATLSDDAAPSEPPANEDAAAAPTAEHSTIRENATARYTSSGSFMAPASLATYSSLSAGTEPGHGSAACEAVDAGQPVAAAAATDTGVAIADASADTAAVADLASKLPPPQNQLLTL